ncbi:serine/threonine protein kinase [Kitasatospora camelliae]|uniref:Serine/threonine protein kinase n=1 Tax=Kitasatospora camelliae TaxID=3156397 RepID=A0AAU8K7B9_9ACTN
MDTVIVQLPDRVRRSTPPHPAGRPAGAAASRPAPELLHMGPGDTADFGRGLPDRPVAVPLTDQGVSRRAGEITAAEDYWRLSNFSSGATYVVENLEGAGEHIKVAPGRLGAPVPFEFSRVVLPSLDGSCHFTVFAPQHAYLATAPTGAGPGPGEHTVSPFALDATAKYFLVLVALCESRLRGTSAAVPGASEVVERLRPLPACRDLTRSAVNYHIDYLARTKLRLRGTEDPDAPATRKREELAALALRFDLVREDHLALLPPRRRPS